MVNISRKFVRDHIADSDVIYQRGVRIYEHGSFILRESNPEKGYFNYHVDGNYGDYTTRIQVNDTHVDTACDCPYPGYGCKHSVAVVLDAMDIVQQWKQAIDESKDSRLQDEEPYYTHDEIKQQAIDDRKHRAKVETFEVTEGEMFKGEHLLETTMGKQYTVTLHDPENGIGHCTCPDFLTNRLGICKHILFTTNYFKKKRGIKKRLKSEKFPFVDIFWDSIHNRPKLFNERPASEIKTVLPVLSEYFGPDGLFLKDCTKDMLKLLSGLDGNKKIRIQGSVLKHLEDDLLLEQMEELVQTMGYPPVELKTELYPYQEDGIRFCLYKKAALIGDEMGLGKTLQAIVLAILKKRIFDFKKVLVVTLASLKEQWKREIERFSDESADIVAGNPKQRQTIYFGNHSLFKITNYEAVLRDVTTLSRFKPDLIILDEAQRIKNFSTKTADAVKRLPGKHALVLTGTPLENKLEDVYSIVQFLDPYLLTPLWQFAADHFMLSREKKGKILGYRNLEQLHERLKTIVIRRRKEEVLTDLPDEVVNNYYVDLHDKQLKIHSGYMQALLPLLNKKFLTPMDLRRIQELLLRMRMVCNSTYLIDRRTHISPKLKELEGIVDELVVQNARKMVIFSEWTTMTYLIARFLSDAGIPFVELSGKIPVKKRQALIDEFTHNPDCRVFLSTDAGGTGLNLQAADCVVNFEMPWNPARINQRIGRVNRIGQKSRCVNVVNLIAKNSIEEKILTGLQLKTDLFKGVFDGGLDVVEFSQEKRTELLNRLKEMMGEDPVPPTREATPSEEIPEDTPHYLNPKALQAVETTLDYTAEEELEDQPAAGESDTDKGLDAETNGQTDAVAILASQAPEKIEAVLNSGMQFIGGLLEMATGKKMEATDTDGRMVRIDKETGEVTLKFKLPGI